MTELRLLLLVFAVVAIAIALVTVVLGTAFSIYRDLRYDHWRDLERGDRRVE